MKRILVSALALAVATPGVAQTAPPAGTTTAAEADAFVATAEKEYFDYSIFGGQVAWVNNTYITDDTDAINARVGTEGTELGVKFAKGAARSHPRGVGHDRVSVLFLVRPTQPRDRPILHMRPSSPRQSAGLSVWPLSPRSPVRSDHARAGAVDRRDRTAGRDDPARCWSNRRPGSVTHHPKRGGCHENRRRTRNLSCER